MSIHINKTIVTQNIDINICGPIPFRKTSDKKTLIRVTYVPPFGYRRLQDPRKDFPKLNINAGLVKKALDPVRLGNIEVTVRCPVCSKDCYSIGRSITYKYELIDLVTVSKNEAVLVCAGQCKELFELSPLSYEKNYNDTQIRI